ncbi:hypothetical protein B7463_g5621, partial [Scytalidium lignicola]
MLTNNNLNEADRQGSTEAHSSSVSTTVNINRAGEVISKIEDIFESIADSIQDNKRPLEIQLKSRRRTGTNVAHNIDTRKIVFPSKSPQEAWRFTVLLRILELSHEALVTGIAITKRDIYYRDPELFIKQSIVDRYVDDLAFTLGINRDSLNVVAAAKGLVAGHLTLVKGDKSILDYTLENEAKGYPDIQSRQFLHFLSLHQPAIPIFALVDFDPDGIGIMSTYKYGSMALAHENQTLVVPEVQWLGVRSDDILSNSDTEEGILRLTSRDRRIATGMLAREPFREDGKEREGRRELQIMLFLNVKAEIQALSNGKGLETWLDGKLQGI